jgi:hypothetical protein
MSFYLSSSEIVQRNREEWFGLALVAGSCEYGIFAGSIEGVEFFDQLNDC